MGRADYVTNCPNCGAPLRGYGRCECSFGTGGYINKTITNADRIRSMTNKDLAELFANDNCGYCRIHDFCFAKGCAINCEDVWLDWLKEEAEA